MSTPNQNSISLSLEGLERDERHVRLDDFLFQLKALQDALGCVDREVNDGNTTLYYRVVDLKHSSPATVRLEPVLKQNLLKTPRTRARYGNSVSLVHDRFFESLRKIRFEGDRAPDTTEETIEAFSEIISGLGKSFMSGSLQNSSVAIPLDAGFHENVGNLVKPGFISNGSVVGELLSISFAKGNKFYLYPPSGPASSIACFFGEDLEKKARACIKRKVRVYGKKHFRASSGLPFRVFVNEIEELPPPRAFIDLGKNRRVYHGLPADESIREDRNGW